MAAHEKARSASMSEAVFVDISPPICDKVATRNTRLLVKGAQTVLSAAISNRSPLESIPEALLNPYLTTFASIRTPGSSEV